MYKELASLIYDNYFLTDYELQADRYIIVAKPDSEYIDDINEERGKLIDSGNTENDYSRNQNLIIENINRLGEEMADLKLLFIK